MTFVKGKLSIFSKFFHVRVHLGFERESIFGNITKDALSSKSNRHSFGSQMEFAHMRFLLEAIFEMIHDFKVSFDT